MAIDSNMVRVSIGTTLIKGDDDLWAKLTDDGYQFAYNFGWISLGKGAWIVVFRRTGHTRVTIIKKPQVAYSQYISCCTQLSLAYLTQVFRRCQSRISNFSDLPSRCTN